MKCPNCSERFRLVADYASHLHRCRPVDAPAEVSESLLARLNAAAEALDVEFGVAEAEEAVLVA